jgi:mRNA interferase MazF
MANRPWPLDCPLVDLAAAGLPAPSKVRFKLFTLDHRLVRGMLGSLAPADAANVRLALNQLLGPPYREPGSMRGQISIADDFDAPLDDFKDTQ